MGRNALASLTIGTGLGALVLGSGGRLAMRGVTLWEHRPHLFSVSGTVAVFLWGAGFGLAAGALRVGLEMAFDRWTPNLSRTARLTTSVVVTLGGALAVLTPWTLPRLSLFPPVVLIFLAAFEMLWQRSASHASEAIKPVAAKDDEPHFS
ncbi:MAG TPA: hypothetical protein VGP84_12740 [Gemmatimonadaceae bacterium]|nr:hypothetical protein [Gemmatimonadaceae bacterium]